MVNITETDKAYLAGIIDGEGSITVRECRPNSFQVYVRIAQSNRPFLENLRMLCGGIGSVNDTKSSLSKRLTSAWAIASKQALLLLEAVYPYLKIKRCQAEGAIELERSISPTFGKKLDKSVLEYRRWVKDRISDLNTGRLMYDS